MPHSNLHSCNANIGFCTPLVSNTPGLSTHSSALKDDFRADSSLGPTWVNVTFAGDLVLDAGGYTIIAHVRFYAYEDSDGAAVKYDLAMGISRTVYPPEETCLPGSYKDADGACQFCPTGAYSNRTDAPACAPCDVGSFATAAADDADGTGVASGASACVPCPPGAYSNAPNGTALCTLCQQSLGEWSSGGTDRCDRCTPGNYARADGACAACPAHANCPGDNHFYASPGYWHESLDVTALVKCEQGKRACAGATAETIAATPYELCEPGYDGVKCAVCEEDYYSVAAGGCTKCQGHEGATVLALAGGVVFVLLVLALMKANEGPITIKLFTTWRRYYTFFFDMAKFKVVWATYRA